MSLGGIEIKKIVKIIRFTIEKLEKINKEAKDCI